jgi:CRP/FNR family cyclic AMP-dependent transcriptional regulator
MPNLFLNLFRDKEATSFAPGQYIFKAGDPGEAMYIVVEGEIEILDGSILLETSGQGSIVGELALIDDAPRSATAIAKTDCKLVLVDRRRFLYMVQETPLFALSVMKVLADRLRRKNIRNRSGVESSGG